MGFVDSELHELDVCIRSGVVVVVVVGVCGVSQLIVDSLALFMMCMCAT